MLPSLIPIFPLPNVVLFPNVFLPLHIFELRYRSMVADALEGDRLIGMVMLQPGWNTDHLMRPSVYVVGCAGLITHVERLEDGRYNIILRGLEKFRIIDEVDRDAASSAELTTLVEPSDAHPYRRARIESLDETVSEEAREPMRQGRHRLEELLASELPHMDVMNMPDEDFVHALAQYLHLEPVEKQALLERPGLFARCQSLIDLIEIKRISARHQHSASRTH